MKGGAVMEFELFDVFLGKKWFDQVSYLASQKMSPEEVKRSLVNHDGYDPGIRVVKKRESAKQKKRNDRAAFIAVLENLVKREES